MQAGTDLAFLDFAEVAVQVANEVIELLGLILHVEVVVELSGPDQ